MKENVSVFGKILFFALALFSFTPFTSAPLALFLGIIFTNIFEIPIKNIGNITKKILQYSIIGLGLGINFNVAVEAGKNGFLFTVATLMFVFGIGYLLAKLLKIDHKTSQLISSGTAICGGSAIAAVSPVIQANNQQSSIALGIVFILNALALFIFPEIGKYFELSQHQFGVWAAVAIHDTSSVVGAASKFGEESLVVATTVKLMRALWIIPLVFVFSFFTKSEQKPKFPYFILGFAGAVLLNSFVPYAKEVFTLGFKMSIATLKLALFLIGTGLSYKILQKVGIRPFIFGVLLWVSISVVSFIFITIYIS